MEWVIPIQIFDTDNIEIIGPNKLQRPTAAISYKDNDLYFSSVSILLPHLVVKSYNAETGKLSLSLHGAQSILNKITALQNLMLNTTHTNHHSWFPGEREKTHEEIAAGFQPLVSNNSIHLYCPHNTVGSFNEIQIYSGGAWSQGTISPGFFSAGKQIRVAIRLQGLSFHQHHITKAWTGKSRIQHRILTIYSD